jgi:hypothetical protein
MPYSGFSFRGVTLCLPPLVSPTRSQKKGIVGQTTRGDEMEIGGIRERLLFAKDLPKDKRYFGESTGTTTRKSKKGEDFTYWVWVGSTEDGVPHEYLILTFSVESAKPFDTAKPIQCYISTKDQKRVWVEPVA